MLSRTVIPWLLLGLAGAVSTAADQPVSFTRDIQPVFEGSCWKCHGGAVQLSKLDLRTREAALKGGEGVAAIVPGKGRGQPAVPRWWQGSRSRPCRWTASLRRADFRSSRTGSTRVRHGMQLRPRRRPIRPRNSPRSRMMPISPEARNYWAFQKPVQVPIPEVAGTRRIRSIAFLEKVRREKGLTSAPRADRDHALATRLHGPDRAAADAGRDR